MTPTDSNARLASLTLERLGFTLAIGWQTTETGHIARWRRRDTLATLLLEKSRLTVAITSATKFTVPSSPAHDAGQVVQALDDAGVVFVAKPKGVV
jgi:hypothetical protein